ncbi:MAG: pilus assembly protein PilM [Nitrospinae bacterium]|nr:pilus assembly protein PilM [Nitrospinota bacterium]
MKLQLPSLIQSGSQDSVGLDIGFHSIKAVELRRVDSGFEVVNFAVREIPKSVLEVKDRSGLIADIIKEMFAERRFVNKNVYLSVSGHNVAIRRTMLPKMPKAEMIEAAKWNAREEILFPVEPAAADCYVMGETEKDGAKFDDLLSIIVRADIIPFLVSIVRKAGLRALGVSVIPIALWDYDRAIHPVPPGTVTSYVDMGAERTRIYFVCDHQLLFSREIPNGGKNVTQSLAGEYEIERGTTTVDEARAEAIKKTHGLPPENADGKTQEGIPLREIRERMLPVLSKQMEELHRSVDYFRNQYKRDSVHRMILSGGAVGLSGLYKLFSEHLGVEIERCNVLLQSAKPVSGVSDKDTKLLGTSLTTAAGLALGKCDKINLLPEEYRFSLKKTLVQLAPWSAVPIFILALLTASVQMRGTVKTQDLLIAQKNAELAQLQQQVVESRKPTLKLADLKKEKESLENEKKMLPAVSGRSVDVPEVLLELARLVPGNTSLSQIAFASGSATGASEGKEKEKEKGKEDREAPARPREWYFEVKGNIFGNEEEVLDTLTHFLGDLKKSSLFKEVKLNNSEAMDEKLYTSPGLQFELFIIPAVKQEVRL